MKLPLRRLMSSQRRASVGLSVSVWLLTPPAPQTSGLLRHAPAFSLLLAVIERAAESCAHCAQGDVAITTLAGGLHLLRNVAAGGVPQNDNSFGAVQAAL